MCDLTRAGWKSGAVPIGSGTCSGNYRASFFRGKPQPLLLNSSAGSDASLLRAAALRLGLDDLHLNGRRHQPSQPRPNAKLGSVRVPGCDLGLHSFEYVLDDVELAFRAAQLVRA